MRIFALPRAQYWFLGWDMLVNRLFVTSWTGGQYPAAPPFKIMGEIKKTTACEERLFFIVEFFEDLFIFGPCTSYLFKSYPYNSHNGAWCQRFCLTFLYACGKDYNDSSCRSIYWWGYVRVIFVTTVYFILPRLRWGDVQCAVFLYLNLI